MPKFLPQRKACLFVAGPLPLARLAWLDFNDGLGANPIEFITAPGHWCLCPSRRV
jgi:methionine sulfoxide reductase heme-binding subunit